MFSHEPCKTMLGGGGRGVVKGGVFGNVKGRWCICLPLVLNLNPYSANVENKLSF
jgi:hypothetical protein